MHQFLNNVKVFLSLLFRLGHFESMYIYFYVSGSLAKGSHKLGKECPPSLTLPKKDSHPYWCFSICAPPGHNGKKHFLTFIQSAGYNSKSNFSLKQVEIKGFEHNLNLWVLFKRSLLSSASAPISPFFIQIANLNLLLT